MFASTYRKGVAFDSRSHTMAEVDCICITSFLTELGWMAIGWQGDELRGNVFGHASQRSAEVALAGMIGSTQAFCRLEAEGQGEVLPTWVVGTIDSLQRFALGEPIGFAEVPLSLDHLTPFGKRVVAACRRICWGQTRAYGDLAAECGSPGAARAVGSVMAKNRYPLVVPCHRVLGAGGSLGGYSAPDGLNMKQRLLEMESWAVSRRPK